jgi:hypothetical protein
VPVQPRSSRTLVITSVAENFDRACFCIGQLVAHQPKAMSELKCAR